MFWDIEFCSKYSLTVDGTMETWGMTRDVKKLLMTKQLFTGSNLELLNWPWLHRQAILEGF